MISRHRPWRPLARAQQGQAPLSPDGYNQFGTSREPDKDFEWNIDAANDYYGAHDDDISQGEDSGDSKDDNKYNFNANY